MSKGIILSQESLLCVQAYPYHFINKKRRSISISLQKSDTLFLYVMSYSYTGKKCPLHLLSMKIAMVNIHIFSSKKKKKREEAYFLLQSD